LSAVCFVVRAWCSVVSSWEEVAVAVQEAPLLVVDDDPAGCHLLTAIFEGRNYRVATARDGPAAIGAISAEPPAAVILDLNLPGMSGMEVLKALRASAPSLPVVILTGFAEIATAVEALRLGAFDYLTKPVNYEELVLSVERALEQRRLVAEVGDLRQQIQAGGWLADQLGPSPEAARVVEQVKQVAPSNLTVLILGETGTGKDLVAHAIHRQSTRGERPFIALDCGAIPETLLESELFGYEKGAFTGAYGRKRGQFGLAEGGTLFLDEVANLPMTLQPKFLRVLQERELHPVGSVHSVAIDVRFVAATNHPLETDVRAGRFRQDLYYRLAEFTISLPPLRARPADIPHLARRFQQEACIELRRPVQEIAPEALELLCAQGWPGNVRELRNVVRQAVLVSSGLVVTADTVSAALTRSAYEPPASAGPHAPRSGRSLKEIASAAADAAETDAIVEALHAAGGNKSEAARLLKTDYKTLYVKMKRLGLGMKDSGPSSR
jgi:DNA-binding NtrC family response regulator